VLADEEDGVMKYVASIAPDLHTRLGVRRSHGMQMILGRQTFQPKQMYIQRSQKSLDATKILTTPCNVSHK